MTAPETVSADIAAARGFQPITTAFLRCESNLLQSLISGLAGTRFLLVNVEGGTEVWRHADDLQKIRRVEDETRSQVRIAGVRRGGAEL